MLRNHEHGYAIMNKDLDSYSFEHIDLETCKKYCRKGDVITRQIPYKSGINISFNWYKPYKWLRLKDRQMNIGWLNISWDYNYLHRTGEVVYSSELL